MGAEDFTNNRETEVEELSNYEEIKLSLEGNNWILPTSIEALDAAENEFEARLEANGWSEEAFFLKLGFREAVINAMVHGNLKIEKPKGSKDKWLDLMQKELKDHHEKEHIPVFVEVIVTPERVYVRVQDQGIGFSREDVQKPVDTGHDLENSGRGLVYMEHGFKTEYRKPGNGGILNEIIMIKERKAEPDSEPEGK